METLISGILIFMIAGALFALHARDLLSALIAQGLVGYGLVICFLVLRAPDLAIVQIVVETITLIFMVAIVLDSTRKELQVKFDYRQFAGILLALMAIGMLLFAFKHAISDLDALGLHSPRMAEAYMEGAAEKTGSANLVTGILFDFRGYDTLGEATILFTAAIGVVTVLRMKGKNI